MMRNSKALALVVALLVPCSALRTKNLDLSAVIVGLSAVDRHGFSSQKNLSAENRASVPGPDYFEENFEQVEFSKEPYAGQMLLDGSLNMTDAQKVWCSHYWEHLLSEASEKLRDGSGTGAISTLAALDAMPALSTAVLFDTTTWETMFLPKLHAAQELVKASRSPEEAHMKELLERLEKKFLLDMNQPQVMFYLGMTDQKTFFYSKPPQTKAVPLLQTMAMHSIDQEAARAKSDKRSIIIGKLFEQVSSLGISKNDWVLDEIMDANGDRDVKDALSSVTPMLAFGLRAEDKGGPCYVLMEGNGRINAIKMALDKMRLTDPSFVAPSVVLNVFDFDGSELARKNRDFFLDLNWRNWFPSVDILGWKRQVPDSIRKVSKTYEAVVKSRPRYFGQEPESSGLYLGP